MHVLWKARNECFGESFHLLFCRLEDLFHALEHGFYQDLKGVMESDVRKLVYHAIKHTNLVLDDYSTE
ncbi:hypothetical protein SB57_07960 [Lactobacillus delbrueckii subsp. bulgaricus]|nr:hypothetical protein SB57_11385 [Lactobacillus delbrueckii subsp. bulgaricus]KIY24356.1 hypothetical protein SB57_07960 [Lactobacillus delbrueckii subsp. bulgaricus]